ncbi:MAG TPA: SIMPL domain-containing protein [Woeseiaceae bacterium]
MATFPSTSRKTAWSITGTLLLCALAACSGERTGPQEVRTVTVTGVGEAQAAPDQAQISAGVQSFGATVIAASRDNEAILSRIMKALASQDIEDDDIGTSNYSIWAEQNYDRTPDQPQIRGYHVSNIVNVTIKDIGKVGDILAAVTNAGANSVHGVQFGVSDTAALESQARERAMADARRRAESLAELADVELGHVVTISTSPAPVFGGLMKSSRMEMSDASAPSPTISPGQQSVSVQVEVTFAIR